MEAEREQLLALTQEAQKASEGANRLKDEFLITLSHELRTPLTSILGWSAMLAGAKLDSATSQNAIEIIRRNAKIQVTMIDDLLDVSRIITGKLRLSVQSVALADIIIAAVESVRPAAEAKGICLELQIGSQAAEVSGDPDRLQQVIWNLASNAIKFTPTGGRVTIRLEHLESHVEIIVTDTGKGIAAEFLPHVFDRFRQADATTTRAFGGLGLGLAIVRQLVELHGGTARVESAGEGQGATFAISLPLVAVRGGAHDAERRAHSQAISSAEFDCTPELEGVRVLVVDDEADTRKLLQIILEECKMLVRAVPSAAEALEALSEDTFDVLVCDIGMPEEDGYTLIEKVRAFGREQGGAYSSSGAHSVHARRRPHPRTTLRLPDSCVEANQPQRIHCHSRHPRRTLWDHRG